LLRGGESRGVLFADQWNNPENPRAHYLTTAAEIWRDTDGKIDAFICSVGTGGTLAGVSQFLRERRPSVVIGCADPEGAATVNLFTPGEASATSRTFSHQ